MRRQMQVLSVVWGAGVCLAATSVCAQQQPAPQGDPWATQSAGTGLQGGLATAGQVSQKAGADVTKAGADAARATGYGMTHPGEVVAKSAAASSITFSETRSGFMEAAETPLRDFNMMQKQIPAVLIEAERHPYDATGLDSCKAITDKVVALDLALGPDVDTPNIEKIRDPYARSASFVASSALDAVKDATNVIPARNVIRRLSGATRYERNVRNAVLAGAVRRGFLKAYGMMRDCDWPAAPMAYQPSTLVASGPDGSGVTTGPASAVGSGAMVVTVASVTGAPDTEAALSEAASPSGRTRDAAGKPPAPAGAWRIGRPLPESR